MKTLSKKLSAMVCLVVLSFASCKKESQKQDEVQSDFKPIVNVIKNTRLNYTPGDTPPGTGGGNGTPVYLNGNGEYATAYGGGITFGSTFTHPASMTAQQNGLLWGPAVSHFASSNNLLGYTLNGPYFTVQFGTFVNGIPVNTGQAMSDYYADFVKYTNGDSSVPSLPSFGTYVSRYGGSSDGIITISGKFILDSASPTYVAITGITNGGVELPPTTVE